MSENIRTRMNGICSSWTKSWKIPYFVSITKINLIYILIRCPAQPNIKHLSCNKQPLMGCVNTSRVWPSLLCLVNQNCLELSTMSAQNNENWNTIKQKRVVYSISIQQSEYKLVDTKHNNSILENTNRI